MSKGNVRACSPSRIGSTPAASVGLGRGGWSDRPLVARGRSGCPFRGSRVEDWPQGEKAASGRPLLA